MSFANAKAKAMSTATTAFAVAGTIGGAVLSGGTSLVVQLAALGAGAVLGGLVGFGVDTVLESKEHDQELARKEQEAKRLLARYEYGMNWIHKNIDASIRIKSDMDYFVLDAGKTLSAETKTILSHIYKRYLKDYFRYVHEQ